MERRSFLALPFAGMIAGPLAKAASPPGLFLRENPMEPFVRFFAPSGIIDFSVNPYSPAVLHCMERLTAGHPYHCFVDGVEIQEVWYVDLNTGVVKTQDVLWDGKLHSNLERLDPAKVVIAREHDILAGNIDPEWTLRPGHSDGTGVLSKTIRGNVDLRSA